MLGFSAIAATAISALPDVASGGSPVDPVLVTSVTSSATGNVTTSYSQALASTATGDINIIAINVSPQANLTDPGIPTIDGTAVDPTPGNTAGGWTTIGTSWDSGSPGPRLTVVYRVRQAGDPSSVTIAWSSVGNYATVVEAFQDGTFDTSTPIEQSAIQPQAASSTSFPFPSMTTTVRGSALYFAGNRTTGTWTLPGTSINAASNPSTANIATAYDTAVAAHTESPTATFTAATAVGNTAIASIKSNPGGSPTSITLPAETGTGTDAITVTKTFTLPAETATGTDAIAVAASVTLEDGAGLYGTGGYGGGPYSAAVDDITVVVVVPQTLPAETGTGSDAATVSAAVPLADPRTGTDVVTVAAALTLADPRTGTDAATVTATVPLADTGAGADALAGPSATIPLPADTGTGTDALSVSGSSSPSLPETGSGTDAVTIAATVAATDTATGTDAIAVTKAFTLPGDTGTGTDALTVAATVPLPADIGAGADALTASGSANPSLPDTASASDALTVAVSLSLADPRTGTDALAVAATIGISDVAAAADALVEQVSAFLADVATGADAATVVVGSPVPDGRAEGAAAASESARAGSPVVALIEAPRPAAWPAGGSDGAAPAAGSGNPTTPRAGG